MSYMGLDVGQTGCRAIIFSDKGAQLSSSYMEYETVVPRAFYGLSSIQRKLLKAASR